MANSRPPLASSASSSGSERSHARSHSKSRRRVDVSDRALTALATQTEARVHWGDILRNDAADEAGTKQWKWLDNMGQFSLYSKTEAGRYAVMARGVLSCSVPEVVHLLHTPHAEQFLQSMEGLYGEDFKDGAFLHRVNLHGLDEDGGVPLNADLLDLSVKSALFGNDHKWSFLDASYRRLDGMGFEKLMTTLNPRDVEGFDHTESGHPHRHHLENIVAAFTVQPEATPTRRERSASGHANLREGLPWKETRVFFYAEVSMPSAYTMSMMHKQPAGRTPPPGALAAAAAAPVHKAVKQRLLTMARSCERLTELVRRRRLGLHEVPERKTSRSLFAGPSRCVCCNKSVVLLAAKHCKLCTQAVCTECSRKHERETFTPGSRRMLVEDVRVCDRCMELVDCAELPELDNHALLAPVVGATPTSTPGVASPAPSPQSSLLTELLNNELLHAETDARKASVMSVIKAMLEQEQLEQEQHDQLSSTKGPSGPFKGHETRAHASSRGGGIMLMPTAPDSGATESFSKLSIH